MENDLLSKVCELAVSVGQFQLEQRHTFSRDRVELKHSHDYVSYVDKESERKLVAALHEMLPEAGFVTEEQTTEQNGDQSKYAWIIDPLDGTTNFIHNLGPWCVCIALRHSHELVLGVVYEVTRNELFYATRGGGAWLRTANGEEKRLSVSTINDTDEALIVIGYPYNADGFRNFATAFEYRMYGHCASIRSFGSAEAELCYVAAGRIDIYIESFIHTWDVSAGAIIISEAGGQVSDYRGSNELWPSGRQVLATNRTLHPIMLNTIKAICGELESKQ